MTSRAPKDTTPACRACGWRGRTTTAGLAAYALRKHSCDKHRAHLVAVARGIAREAAIDRYPKDCHHKEADHQHGTYACYTLDGCRCLPCAAARSSYDQDRGRRIAYDRVDWTAAEPVRAHVRELAAGGMGYKRVATLAGISHGAMTKLLYGLTRADGTHRPPSARVRPATAAAILAVRPGEPAAGARVTAVGTVRRLQGLIALGWSVERLASEAGTDRQALDRVLKGHDTTVSATAQAVRSLYERLSSTPPPESTPGEKTAASRSRARAAAHRWPVPAWWDDDELDDPAAAAPTVGKASPWLDLDEWCHLVRYGERPDVAAARCGVSWSAVEVAIARQGHVEARRLLERAWAAAS